MGKKKKMPNAHSSLLQITCSFSFEGNSSSRPPFFSALSFEMGAHRLAASRREACRAVDVALLRGLQDGLALGKALALVSPDGQAPDISHTLALLIQHQLITDVTQAPTEHTTQGD